MKRQSVFTGSHWFAVGQTWNWHAKSRWPCDTSPCCFFFLSSAEHFFYRRFGSFTKASKEHSSLRRQVLHVLHAWHQEWSGVFCYSRAQIRLSCPCILGFLICFRCNNSFLLILIIFWFCSIIDKMGYTEGTWFIQVISENCLMLKILVTSKHHY